MPDKGFNTIFDRIDELSEYLRVLYRKYWRPGPHLAVDETIQRFMGRAPEIVNIPTKPTPEGDKKEQGPQDLYRSFLEEDFTKTQAVVLDLLTQRHPDTDERLYPPDKHVVWLDNLFSSVKLFERLRSLRIGAAGTVRTTRTKREEMGEEEYNIEKITIEQQSEQQSKQQQSEQQSKQQQSEQQSEQQSLKRSSQQSSKRSSKRRKTNAKKKGVC
ncbi:hypothetical protein K432DRAFT_398181 [Lepidopterella palustris CBS 459.81]|uniref:PiggyBac transposable element-derived protein domain-containing protein n=1 Tax=Lepidopterella palustris CBS 459.81 TaxID=1314670 RepID=A0A8E2DZ03_9PEZI|nr:hypothetical protein K432DRAFT_398181 [Lepidopterella palustris CBS 459.81]